MKRVRLWNEIWECIIIDADKEHRDVFGPAYFDTETGADEMFLEFMHYAFKRYKLTWEWVTKHKLEDYFEDDGEMTLRSDSASGIYLIVLAINEQLERATAFDIKIYHRKIDSSDINHVHHHGTSFRDKYKSRLFF